ncbi:MAG: type II toxin-antitoxin system VapC family toxin [Holophagales bacterium]|jgi:predicted nucleic acid-binding protein|nr:type II toxin-antitoxin system VapC family toxin [Holophagales bacterium]
MNGRFVFDTNAIVYYLQGRNEWVEYIDNAPMAERAASVITRIELLSYPEISPAEEESISRFLGDLVVVPLNKKVEDIATAIRRTVRMKLPDAIVAATAISMEATLISGDHQFKSLEWPGLHVAMPT